MEIIQGLPNNRYQAHKYPLTDDLLFQPWTAEHRRWSCYRYYGVACTVEGCTRTGTHVIHWYDAKTHKKHGETVGEHIDLIGYDLDGTPFLMTVDHIIPKKFGAPKIWWNLQPMCFHHNSSQGAKMHHKPNRSRLETIVEQARIPVGDSVVTIGSRIMKQLEYEELYKIILDHYKKELINC